MRFFDAMFWLSLGGMLERPAGYWILAFAIACAAKFVREAWRVTGDTCQD